MNRTALKLIALCSMLCMLLSASGSVSTTQDAEQRVKAAFVFNFAKYTQWPRSAFPSSSAPIIVGCAGEVAYQDAVEKVLKGKRVRNRRFEVVKVSPRDEIVRPHILLIGELSEKREAEILRSAQGAPVLIIGHAKGFATRGGVINFYIEDNRVRFEINPEAARSAKLTISSQLLKLARIVKGESQ